jgi:hypothetical protein
MRACKTEKVLFWIFCPSLEAALRVRGGQIKDKRRSC